MANASRVAEIFQQASVAFGRLSQLTIDLKLAQLQQADTEQKENAKWTATEIEQLKSALTRFGNDLGKIAESIETKTLSQIKQMIKSKTLQEAGFSQKNVPEIENMSKSVASTSETSSTNQTSGVRKSDVVSSFTQVEKGRRKQNLEEVSEAHDPPKRPRLNDFLDISSSAETKQEKLDTELPASFEHPAPTDVKNDGVFFKRQVKSNLTISNTNPSSIPIPHNTPGAVISKLELSRPASIINKSVLKFHPKPTTSGLSGKKYEDYEDSEEEDADEYEDFDEDDDDAIDTNGQAELEED